MPGSDTKFPKFARAYQEIRNGAKEYRILDVQKDTDIEYAADLNTRGGVTRLAEAIDEFKPDVILCMETLEHVNYHFEVMNTFAAAIDKYATTCLITLPNNSNWIVNHVIGIDDHSVAFFKDVALRFVTRSDLGKHALLSFPCTGKYTWSWPVAYVLSGFQPTSFGFLIGSRQKDSLFNLYAAKIQQG